MPDPFEIGPLTAGDLITTIAAVNNRPFDGSVVLAAKYRLLREELERAGEGARLVVVRDGG